VLLAQRFVGSGFMVAWMAGTLVVVGVLMGIVLALYAIYWMIFKMGKG
jgi:hypothetical protein